MIWFQETVETCFMNTLENVKTSFCAFCVISPAPTECMSWTMWKVYTFLGLSSTNVITVQKFWTPKMPKMFTWRGSIKIETFLQLFPLFSGESRNVLVQYIRKTTNQLGLSMFECTLCDQAKNRQRNNVLNHVESVHFPGNFLYSCEYCQKEFVSKNARNVHISRNHKFS